MQASSFNQQQRQLKKLQKTISCKSRISAFWQDINGTDYIHVSVKNQWARSSAERKWCQQSCAALISQVKIILYLDKATLHLWFQSLITWKCWGRTENVLLNRSLSEQMKGLLPAISTLDCTAVKQRDTCERYSWQKISQLILCLKCGNRGIKLTLGIPWILGRIIRPM